MRIIRWSSIDYDTDAPNATSGRFECLAKSAMIQNPLKRLAAQALRFRVVEIVAQTYQLSGIWDCQEFAIGQSCMHIDNPFHNLWKSIVLGQTSH